MVLRFAVVAAVIATTLVFAQQRQVLQNAGLLGSCSQIATPDGSERRLARVRVRQADGHSRPLARLVRPGRNTPEAQDFWRCPTALESNRSGNSDPRPPELRSPDTDVQRLASSKVGTPCLDKNGVGPRILSRVLCADFGTSPGQPALESVPPHSRFPDASLRPCMRAEQCCTARAARRKGLSGARRRDLSWPPGTRCPPPFREAREGADQNRTGVRGFAGLCLTTRPRRPNGRMVSRAEIAVYAGSVERADTSKDA